MTVTAAGSTGTAALAETELLVEGMTCGACAARVERKLRKIDGVRASVNFATGRATVMHPEARRAAGPAPPCAACSHSRLPTRRARRPGAAVPVSARRRRRVRGAVPVSTIATAVGSRDPPRDSGDHLEPAPDASAGRRRRRLFRAARRPPRRARQPRRALTPSSPHRRARRAGQLRKLPCSASPTGSAASSCPSCSCSPPGHGGSGRASAPPRTTRSRPRSPS